MLRPCRRGLVFLLFLAFPPPVRAQDCGAQRTALVLSGGGAKGIAHIGVLRVLDSLRVRLDLIVGTSMGAVVGALYASGYSGAELDSLVRTVPLAELFRSYQPRAPHSLGLLQPLIVWEQGARRFNLQSATVDEPAANALVNAAMLRGNLLARGDFDSLPIPFRAVATDLSNREPVVLRSGDLAQAVRASAAIPLLFLPEARQGRYLVDGGLSANVPVAVARAEGAERVIVVDATEHPSDTVDFDSPLLLADRLLSFLFQQPPAKLGPRDLMIRPAIDRFTSLNFSPRAVAGLLQVGANAADSVLPREACLPRRNPPALALLPRWLSGVTIPGANRSERLALIRILGLGLGDTLDVKLLRSRLRLLSTSEAYRSVWLDPKGTGDSVSFVLDLRRAARRIAGVGLAYDNELGGRMWAGIVDRRLFDLALEGSAALLLGELRSEAYAGLRRNFQLGRQLINPTLTARIATEDVRRFAADGDELAPAPTRELIGFGGAERRFEHGWDVAVGAVGHAWHQPGRSRSTVGALARVTRETASRGRMLYGELLWTGVYQRAALQGEMPLRAGVVRITPRLRLGWGDGLPPQAGFPLGGDDGFPGLHLGERRGDRESMLGLMFTVPLRGPLLGRIELAGGRTAQGGGWLGSDGWLGGVRAGIGADTPVGPVRFEYGLATGNRGVLFVRIGRWF
jgi:NTE family protein